MAIQQKPTVGMLLDINNYSGEHSGRLGPWIATIAFLAVPPMLFVYFGLYQVVPVFIAIPAYLFLAVRILLIIPGREKYRLEGYKKVLNGIYTEISSMLRVKQIYDDGCTEFVDGTIHYYVVALNNTIEDKNQHARELERWLASVVGDCEFNIYIPNIIDAPMLMSYYDKVNAFSRNESANNFVQVIDTLQDLVRDTSLLQLQIFDIKGYRSDWKTIRAQIDSAVLDANKLFKYVYRVNNSEAINAIINRDIDSVVIVDDMLRMKYRTGAYASSEVLAWDDTDSEVSIGDNKQTSVLPPEKENSFHIAYTDEKD